MILLLATAGASAEVYKWTENGTVHYGSTPPPGQEAETIDAPSGPPDARTDAAQKALDERIKQSQQQREREAEQAKQAEESARRQAAREQYCKTAKQSLEQLQTVRRLQYINEQGERAYLSEEQRQQRIEKARKIIQENCVQQ